MTVKEFFDNYVQDIENIDLQYIACTGTSKYFSDLKQYVLGEYDGTWVDNLENGYYFVSDDINEIYDDDQNTAYAVATIICQWYDIKQSDFLGIAFDGDQVTIYFKHK